MYKEPKRCLGFCQYCRDRVHNTDGSKQEGILAHTICREKPL